MSSYDDVGNIDPVVAPDPANLAHFDAHYKDLQDIEPLLTETYFRERFEEKCLKLPNAPSLPTWGGGKLYAPRWLCVFEWCKSYLDETHQVLKQCFKLILTLKIRKTKIEC